MTGRRHGWLIVLAFAALIASSMLLYRILPVVGLALGVGSGAGALVVMAHVGVLAALLAPFVALRRRSRGRKP